MTRDLDLLADAEGRAVALGDIGEHPHGRDVGDRIGRRRIARLDQQVPGAALRAVMRPEIGLGTTRIGST